MVSFRQHELRAPYYVLGFLPYTSTDEDGDNDCDNDDLTYSRHRWRKLLLTPPLAGGNGGDDGDGGGCGDDGSDDDSGGESVATAATVATATTAGTAALAAGDNDDGDVHAVLSVDPSILTSRCTHSCTQSDKQTVLYVLANHDNNGATADSSSCPIARRRLGR